MTTSKMHFGAFIDDNNQILHDDFADCEGWESSEDLEFYLASIGFTKKGDGVWANQDGQRVIIVER